VIAGIDVHKKMLAVVVANGEVDDEYRFAFEGRDEPRRPARARRLAQRVHQPDSASMAWTRRASAGQRAMIVIDPTAAGPRQQTSIGVNRNVTG
jgi:hypothetical protein